MVFIGLLVPFYLYPVVFGILFPRQRILHRYNKEHVEQFCMIFPSIKITYCREKNYMKIRFNNNETEFRVLRELDWPVANRYK